MSLVYETLLGLSSGTFDTINVSQLNVTNENVITSTITNLAVQNITGAFIYGATGVFSSIEDLGTLIVYGTGTFNNNVNIYGNAYVNDNLNVNGSVGVAQYLAVGLNTTIAGDLTVGGNEFLGGNLGVTGASTFGGTGTFNNNVNIYGNAYVNDNLNVNGSCGISQYFSVGVDATIEGNLIVDTNTTLFGTANIYGDVDLFGAGTSLYVNNNSTFNGTGTFNKNLNVLGNEVLTGNLHVGMLATLQASATVASNFTVGGVTTLNAPTIINSNLQVNGTGTFSNDVNVGGNSLISGNEVVSGNLTVQGYELVDGIIDVAGAGTIGSTLTVGGTGTFNSNVNIAGVLLVSQSAAVDVNLVVGNQLSVFGPLIAYENLNVTSTGTFNADVHINGFLFVGENTSLAGALVVQGPVVLNNDSYFLSTGAFSQGISVTQGMTISGVVSSSSNITTTGNLYGNEVFTNTLDSTGAQIGLNKSIIPTVANTYQLGNETYPLYTVYSQFVEAQDGVETNEVLITQESGSYTTNLLAQTASQTLDFQLPPNYGNTGTYLQTDGAGILTWSTPRPPNLFYIATAGATNYNVTNNDNTILYFSTMVSGLNTGAFGTATDNTFTNLSSNTQIWQVTAETIGVNTAVLGCTFGIGLYVSGSLYGYNYTYVPAGATYSITYSNTLLMVTNAYFSAFAYQNSGSTLVFGNGGQFITIAQTG